MRVVFPRLQGQGEQFPALPRICNNKKVFTLLGGGFVYAVLKVGDTKQNFLPKNAAAHTVL